MRINLIMLVLCFSLILAATSCNKTKSGPVSGTMSLSVSDTSVSFYYTAAFSKNKKQEIILAYWDNMPRPAESEFGPDIMRNPPDITCSLAKSDSAVKFECVGEFDGKTGRGKVNINGKVFDVSNGRLFLINTLVKPIKVIQLNEQFNLPPFNDLSCLDLPFTKKIILNAFSSCDKKFEYLAKNNKTVAAFLADSKKKSDSSKTKIKELKSKTP
ncbi:MAG: hypothetical protein GY750_13515 [Lentisphaerae bacterium]|nr:hypothetical protein [Lentisphaerota bacterium]MCP4102421.1 hypothetical protein [Lentisphaerota bacterium]